MTPRARPATSLLLALSLLLPACGVRTGLKAPAHRDAGAATTLRDGAPDLPGDDRPDLEPPPRRDSAPDLKPDEAPDLPSERVADVVVPADRGLDLVTWVDAATGWPGDLPLGPDLPTLVDGPCADGATVPCTCSNGASGNRICLPSRTYSECGCGSTELMRVRNGLIGTWIGTATTPWVPPYPVTFTFDSYTHYSAKSLAAGQSALYYGVDDDSPDKRYDVNDIEDNGDASGYLDLWWGPNQGAPTREALSGIQLAADGSKLSFWFLHRGSYGPLQYDLQRVLP